MTKVEILTRIREVGLIPVLRATSHKEAIAIAHAIHQGGVSVLEITMTVPGAIDVIRELLASSRQHLLIGAGTVLDPETARACILAGAQFIVSPSLKISTIELCHRYSIPVFPGALTPTEVLTAWEAGADAVKVFPCGSLGGAKYLQSLKAPLPQIEFIPTGGVSLATASDFLAAGALALGVGADLVDMGAAAAGNFALITENSKKYREIVQKHRA